MNDSTASGRRRGRKAAPPSGVKGVVCVSNASVVEGQAVEDDVPVRKRQKRAPAAARGVPDVIVPLRHRHDGWTPIKQRAFLRYLSELGSVTDACKHVGMSTTSAERLRKRSAEFADAWDKAVSTVAPILEQAAYERGVEGWDEPVFQGGVQVGVKRRFSDAALRMLMQARSRAEAAGMAGPDLATASVEELDAFAHEAAKRAGGVFTYHARSQEDVDAALMERLDTMAEHHRRQAEARGEVWVSGYFPPDARCGDVAERGAQHDDPVEREDGD